MLELLAGDAPVGVEVEQHRLAAGGGQLHLEIIQRLDADKLRRRLTGIRRDGSRGGRLQQILAHYHGADHRQQQHEAAHAFGHRVGLVLVVVIEVAAQQQPPAEPGESGNLIAPEP